MSHPRLLFLAQILPHPPDGGVKIRTYHVLRLLAREFEVDALCFHRRSAREDSAAIEESVEALREHAALVEAFEIPQERSRTRLLWDHLRSVLRRRPYTYFSYESSSFLSRLRELLKSESYDLVHVDSLDLSRYLSELPDRPVVCGHHNVESELLRRRGDSASFPPLRWYFRLQADLLEREEDRWCPRVALNVTVSDRDRQTLEERVPGAEVLVAPNGVDTETFRPAGGEEGTESGLVFVGGCTWFPNRDALEYFSAEILPLLRRQRPDLTVRWVGRADRETRARYRAEHGIEMTGYVDDIRPHMRAAACYVVPLRVGGGTRLKILDAWAMGMAVVSTSQGCEGLRAEDGENILIRDSAEGFARAVERVLDDPALRRRLGRRARETTEEVYAWDVIGEEMNAAYRALLEETEPGRVGRDVAVDG